MLASYMARAWTRRHMYTATSDSLSRMFNLGAFSSLSLASNARSEDTPTKHCILISTVNNYIVRSYRDVIVVTNIATRRIITVQLPCVHASIYQYHVYTHQYSTTTMCTCINITVPCVHSSIQYNYHVHMHQYISTMCTLINTAQLPCVHSYFFLL